MFPKRLPQISIKAKLALAFLFLIFVTSLSGAGGLIHINRIQKTVANLTDIATPMFELSNRLVDELQRINSGLSTLLSADRLETVKAQDQHLSACSKNFARAFGQLKEIIAKARIDLDLKDLIQARTAFFQQMPQVILFNLEVREEAEGLGRRHSEFETLKNKIDHHLIQLLNGAKAEMTTKEEEGKILVQSGNASVTQMNALLSGLFNQDYYLIDGVTTLRNILSDISENADVFTAEETDGALAGIAARHGKLEKKFNSRLKRIKGRLKSEEARTAYGEIKESFKALGDKATGAEGLFQCHRRILALNLEIQNHRASLDLVTGQFKKNLHLVLEEAITLNQTAQSNTKNEVSNARRNIIILVSIAAAACVLIGVLISRTVVRPIRQLGLCIRDIAEGDGDLTARLDVIRRDEVGEVSLWFNRFMAKLQEIIGEIRNNAENLGTASSGLFELSGRMSKEVSGMSGKFCSVDKAAGKLSSMMSKVSTTTEESSENIRMISAAAEQMTATITEIAKNTTDTRETSNQAASRTRSAEGNINRLIDSAREIGDIIKTIDDISRQTNLLALNATIEATRAGESGKGFAVVANEIKNLARQTAGATLNIQERIKGIQDATSQTVGEIKEVSSAMHSVNEMIDAVAAAVQEQSRTTADIAENVGEAAQKIEGVSQRISQGSQVSNDIAKEIADVNKSSEKLSTDSQAVDSNADSLREMSEQFKRTLVQFRI